MPESQIRDVSLLRLRREQGHDRTMQRMADDSQEISKAMSTTLMTLSAKVNQGLIEIDPLQAMGVSTALTRIDPISQVSHSSRDAVLLKAIEKLGS